MDVETCLWVRSDQPLALFIANKKIDLFCSKILAGHITSLYEEKSSFFRVKLSSSQDKTITTLFFPQRMREPSDVEWTGPKIISRTILGTHHKAPKLWLLSFCSLAGPALEWLSRIKTNYKILPLLFVPSLERFLRRVVIYPKWYAEVCVILQYRWLCCRYVCLPSVHLWGPGQHKE